MNKKVICLLFGLFFTALQSDLTNAQSTTGCAVTDIQTRLDTGQSVYKVMNDCAGLTISDFYGKNYAGGVIAYLDSTKTGTGIIAAVNDANENSTWGSAWQGISYSEKMLASGIGSGKSNTEQYCQNAVEDSPGCLKSAKNRWQGTGPYLYGFYFAANYEADSYSDWYLPGADELTTAISNYSAAFTSCPNSGWWSSTQVPQNYISQNNQNENVISAFSANSNAQLQVTEKMDGRCVRAFRSFGPWIDTLSTSIIEAGLTVTLDGSNFGNSPASIEVQLPNGKKVIPQLENGGIKFVVPNGVTAGLMRIVVNGVQSNQKEITVVPKPNGVPQIDSISVQMMIQNSLRTNEKVMTIYGSNFSLVENIVTFAGHSQNLNVKAHVTASTSQINVSIPSSALTGPIHVSNSVGESQPSADSLYVFEFATPAGTLTTSDLNEVAIDSTGNTLVAVGKKGVILVSENEGVSWYDSSYVRPYTSVTPTSKIMQDFNAALYNQSSDLYSVIYSKHYKHFFIFGGLGTSYDDKNFINILNTDPTSYSWVANSTDTEIRESFAVGSQILATKGSSQDKLAELGYWGDRYVFQWNDLQSNVTEIMSFSADSSNIVTVGQTAGAFWKSTIPATDSSWTEQNESRNLRSVTYGNSVFVSVGGSTFLYSMDGSNWRNASCIGRTCSPSLSVAFNKRFGMFYTGGPALYNNYSMDGKTWRFSSIPTKHPSSECSVEISDVKPTKDGFIMVGKCGFVGRMSVKMPEH